MSKKSHDKSVRREILQDPLTRALPDLLSPVVPATTIVTPSSVNLREIEDRRLFHPAGRQRPVFSLDNEVHRLVASAPKVQRRDDRKSRSRSVFSVAPVALQSPDIGSFNRRPTAFNAPKKVLVCVRREQRKEVLHALRKTGKGGGQKRPRFNQWSNVRCK